MADAKITGLSEDTAPTTDDLVVTVNDPAGTPANRKVTLANLTKGLGGAWATFTPTWSSSGSSPSIGNATVVANYTQVGKLVTGYINITFGNTTSFGTGNYYFALPVTAAMTVSDIPPIGNWSATTGGGVYMGLTGLQSTTLLAGIYHSAGVNGQAANYLGATTPDTFANTHRLRFNFTYEAA